MRVAILDNNLDFIKHFNEDFHSRYVEQFELFSYTDEAKAYEALNREAIDVFLVSSQIAVKVRRIPKGCGFSYLTEEDVSEFSGFRAMGRYRKAEELLRDIQDVYENREKVVLCEAAVETQLIAVVGTAGGVGSSTVAAAYANRLVAQGAIQGEKILYLNMEQLPSVDYLFSTPNKKDYELLAQIKAEHEDACARLKDIVEMDESGVYILSKSQIADDTSSVSDEDILLLLMKIKAMSEFDVVILDMDSNCNSSFLKYLEICEKVILLTNGLDIPNFKLYKKVELLNKYEAISGQNFMNKISIMYNQFNAANVKIMKFDNIQLLGGIKYFENGTAEDIVKSISKLEVFDLLGKK